MTTKLGQLCFAPIIRVNMVGFHLLDTPNII